MGEGLLEVWVEILAGEVLSGALGFDAVVEGQFGEGSEFGAGVGGQERGELFGRDVFEGSGHEGWIDWVDRFVRFERVIIII